jgi:alkaline phosphatase D
VIRRAVTWLDARSGSVPLVRKGLRYVFPDHWSFLLGEIALYTFVVLVGTGIYLTFFFHPSYETVALDTTVTWDGIEYAVSKTFDEPKGYYFGCVNVGETVAPGEAADNATANTTVEYANGTEETFTDIVFEGVLCDCSAMGANDHTVKVDLDGHLAADTEYHYRFIYDGVASQIGRCRTLPEPDASPESMRFAVLSCQNYLNGYFPALHYVAQEDVDFIVHVGDFIYESDAGDFKGLGSNDYPGREKTLPSGHERVRTLEDYRYLYRKYHSDPHLQRALEQHARIFTWDDHEFANDIYWDDNGVPRAPDHPADEGENGISRLVEAALKAWWEYTPTRAKYDEDATRKRRNEAWRRTNPEKVRAELDLRSRMKPLRGQGRGR